MRVTAAAVMATRQHVGKIEIEVDSSKFLFTLGKTENLDK